VEEIQWSPTEKNVLASASSDGTIKVWDVRSKSRTAALSVKVSNVDVNVMSWSHSTAHLLASGDDAGVWSVWDLRNWKPDTANPSKTIRSSPVASFNFHKEQITSIEWHPTDDSIVAVAAGDDTITLWDLAVELDEEEMKGGEEGVPPQLLFVHYLERAKEAHWHPQIPGVLVGTGESFNVFKTISV
jgi:ribosome assembly protein RRB1